MRQSNDTMRSMTWWTWLNSIRGDDSDAQTARRLGVSASAVGRWKTSTPDPARAAAVARTYGRPVLEAFVAAGFLTPEEAGERPSAPPSLTGLDDDALLDEVRRRMKEVSNAGRSPKDQKTDEQQEPGRQEGGSDDRQSDAEKSPRGGGVTSLHDRRRQKVIDQGLPVEEAADDHPFDLPPDDEDVSQDPDDWGNDE